MERTKSASRRAWLLPVAILLVAAGGFSLWQSYSYYLPPPEMKSIPEANGKNGLPENPREHMKELLEELDLSRDQWAALARLGPPKGPPEEREAHAEKIAAVLNDEQYARFSEDMRRMRGAVIGHMMEHLSPQDQQAMLRRLERHPEGIPGPPAALMMPRESTQEE